MRVTYPSDVSLEQFEIIRSILESARKVTHPRRYDLYDIFCAVLYVLRESCRWRSLPHDYPPWKSVYYHFMIWREKDEDGVSILDKVLRMLVDMEREKGGVNLIPQW
jgi:transposase